MFFLIRFLKENRFNYYWPIPCVLVLSWSVLTFLFVLLGSGTVNASDGSELAFQRVKYLSKSINVYRWFGRDLVESERHYKNYISDEELLLIRKWGFTAIRLPVKNPFLFNIGETVVHDPKHVAILISAIERINRAGLAVIVDYHGRDRKRMEGDNSYRIAIIGAWKLLAEQLSRLASNEVFFEILNEPRFVGRDEQWMLWQEAIADAIRVAAPNNTLLATSTQHSDPQTFSKLRPLEDDNQWPQTNLRCQPR